MYLDDILIPTVITDAGKGYFLCPLFNMCSKRGFMPACNEFKQGQTYKDFIENERFDHCFEYDSTLMPSADEIKSATRRGPDAYCQLCGNPIFWKEDTRNQHVCDACKCVFNELKEKLYNKEI